MVQDEINAKGGLKLKSGQKKVELVEYDDRSQPGETSTRTVGNYLRGRLPAVVDGASDFSDVRYSSFSSAPRLKTSAQSGFLSAFSGKSEFVFQALSLARPS